MRSIVEKYQSNVGGHVEWNFNYISREGGLARGRILKSLCKAKYDDDAHDAECGASLPEFSLV